MKGFTAEPIEVCTPQHKSRRQWLLSTLLRLGPDWLARPGFLRDLARRVARKHQRRLLHTTAAGAIAGAILIALSLPPQALSATIEVDETNCTLVDAILSANTNTAVEGCMSGSPGVDTISLLTDVSLTEGAFYYDRGLPPVTESLIIVGNAHQITREATAPEFGIFTITADVEFTIRDATISGGRLANGNGSAIRGEQASITIIGSNLADNHAVNGFGGSIYTRYCDISIVGSIIDGSSAGRGGGINTQGGNLTISASTLSSNSATRGGAIYIDSRGENNISDSVIRDNLATDGAGVFSSDQLNINRTTLSGNSASEQGGAAFHDNNHFPLTLNEVTISDNAAGLYGGGVLSRGRVFINNSTISGNSSDHRGGGIAKLHQGRLTVNNSTVTGNSAAKSGGGVFSRFDVLGNPPFGTTELTLNRTIVSGNTAANAGDELYDFDRIAEVNNFNVFGHAGLDRESAFFRIAPGSSDIDLTSDSPDASSLDQLLDIDLEDNGGATETHALMLGSPAIDLGPSADCAASPIDGFDQRALMRNGDGDSIITDHECDSGAYELQIDLPTATPTNTPLPPTSTATPNVTATPTVTVEATLTTTPQPTASPTASPTMTAEPVPSPTPEVATWSIFLPTIQGDSPNG